MIERREHSFSNKITIKHDFYLKKKKKNDTSYSWYGVPTVYVYSLNYKYFKLKYYNI